MAQADFVDCRLRVKQDENIIKSDGFSLETPAMCEDYVDTIVLAVKNALRDLRPYPGRNRSVIE